MSEFARVGDVDEIKHLTAVLRKFAETANVALSDAESEINRTRNILERDAPTHWKGQLKKRKVQLEQAKEQLRQKQLFKTQESGRQSFIDEKKLVQRCKLAVEEAETKLQAIKQWERRFDREVMQYKGQTQALARSLEAGVPKAAALLESMITSVEQYLAAATGPGQPTNMARGGDETPPEDDQADQTEESS